MVGISSKISTQTLRDGEVLNKYSKKYFLLDSLNNNPITTTNLNSKIT